MKDLSTVNYFVGKNGSGKSSILNAITYLGNPGDASNSRHFFNEESVVQLTVFQGDESFVNKLVWNADNPNKVDPVFQATLAVSLDGERPEMGANVTARAVVSYQQDSQRKETIAFLNETLTLLDLPQIEVSRIQNLEDPWDDQVGKRVFKHDGIVINPFMLAQGVQAFNNFRFHLQQVLDISGRAADTRGFIVVMEEVDNDLHPELQKKIPRFIENVIQEISEDVRNKIQFFISTHSPFVIGKVADYDDQKVYIVDEGFLVDLEGNQSQESSGFTGQACAWIVGQMLGADILDLGYPENYCIVEEYSLSIILGSCKEKGIVRNYQFISAAGDSKIIGLTERFDNFMQLNTLIKCNPYYHDKYLVIVDNTDEFNAKQKERFIKLKEKIGDRFTEMTKHSLEEYYDNIDPAIGERFTREFKELNGDSRAQGIKKADFAKEVSQRINSASDFSKLFSGHLDFLIR